MAARSSSRRGGCVVLLLALLVGLTAPAAPASTAADDVLQQPGVLVDPAVPAPPLPDAAGWIVADVDSGDVLAASGARTPLAPASTLKLLTALALSPGHDDAELYTATDDPPAVDGSKAGIVAASQYRYTDLLHALLMASGNDAAVAMGELAGGQEQAVARMNEVAADLGASDTLAANTSGLDAPGQVSSARDLALLAAPVLADARLAQVVLTPQYAFPGAGEGFGRRRSSFVIGNHNRLLGSYEGTIGLKNGYTDAARGALVAAAERDGRRLVVVVLRAEGSEADQCAALLDWAFALPATARPVTTLQASVDPAQDAAPPTSARAAGGSDTTRADAGQAAAAAAAVEPATEQDAGPWPLRTVVLVLVGLLVGAVLFLRLTRDTRIARRRATRAAALRQD